jgi:mono/diheme cytochrome c family protein
VKKIVRYSPLFLIVALAACGGNGDAPAPATQDAPQPGTEPAVEAVPSLTMALPEGVTAEMVARGQQVFEGAGICYTCHMQGGVGGPLGPNLTDDRWINTDGSFESIVNVVLNGVTQPIEHPGIMLPRGGTNISDDDVRAVSAYVWTLSRGS